MTSFRGLAFAVAAASAMGLTALASPAQAWHGGPHWRHGWGGPPAYGFSGWRGYGPRPWYRPMRAYGPRCVARPRWVDGPWGPQRVWVRRCW
ncbi:MAG: sulfur globule protein precursor [Methylobacteriaceae bacterium]|nr:sulfur globule protein precursor [Methylobacteriaceae bacterium]